MTFDDVLVRAQLLDSLRSPPFPNIRKSPTIFI